MARLERGEVMAGGPGIEPGFLESKSNVLPLDDPPTEVCTLKRRPLGRQDHE